MQKPKGFQVPKEDHIFNGSANMRSELLQELVKIGNTIFCKKILSQ